MANGRAGYIGALRFFNHVDAMAWPHRWLFRSRITGVSQRHSLERVMAVLGTDANLRQRSRCRSAVTPGGPPIASDQVDNMNTCCERT
jgi:hypothetical protein